MALLLALLVSIPGAAFALDRVGEGEGAGRLVVKYRAAGPSALGECAQRLASEGRPFRGATADDSGSLDALHARLGVRGIRALFRRSDGRPFAEQRRALARRLESLRAARTARRPAVARAEPAPDLAHVYLVDLADPADLERAAALYRSDPHVEWAQPDYAVQADFTPDDPFLFSSGSWGQPYPDLWGLEQIGAEAAWQSTRGEGVVIGVVDSGLDYEHPDIAAHVFVNPGEDLDANGRLDASDLNGVDDDGNGLVDDLRGFDFASSVDANEDGDFDDPEDTSDADPFDDFGHGTHVAGTAAAIGGNGLGMIGVAPAARILAVKALDERGSGVASDLARGVLYAAETGADVINNSWSCSVRCPSNPVVEEAVHAAVALGSVLVFSAGNKTDDVAFYSPQNLRETLSVAATDPSDAIAPFSNFGLLVDVAAPGAGFAAPPPGRAPNRGILSLRSSGTASSLDGGGDFIVGGDYLRLSGTSMSAPHVAGLVALIRARHPDLESEDVRNLVRLTADDLGTPGHDAQSGAGRINAARALALDPVPHLRAALVSPEQGATLRQKQGEVELVGTAAGADFTAYEIAVGAGVRPTAFVPLGPTRLSPVLDGVLAVWSVAALEDGPYVLRLAVIGPGGIRLEEFVQITLERNPPERISQAGLRAEAPAVSGDLVAWHTPSDASGGEGGLDLFVRDLADGSLHAIAQGAGDQAFAALSGDRVVWQDTRNHPEFEVFSCRLDRASGGCPETPIALGAIGRDPPLVSGDRIVWGENGAVMLCEVDPAGACTPRPVASGGQSSPAIDGRRIVWVAEQGLDTCELDPRSGECPARSLDVGGLFHFYPRISDDRIAWTEFSGGPIAIRVCALDPLTGACPPLEIARPRDTTYPVVSGDRIVWNDVDAARNVDVYFCEYDARRGICPIQRLTGHPAAQRAAAVDGSRVVFEDLRNGLPEVMGIELPTLDPVGDRRVHEGSELRIALSARARAGDAVELSAAQASGAPLEALGAELVVLGDGSGELRWRPTFEQAGRYLLSFTATSDSGLETYETVAIEVLDVDRAPVALAGPDRIVRGRRSIALDGCRSFDPEGKPLTYLWLDRSGAELSRECRLVRTAPPHPQLEAFRLVVSDGTRSASDRVRVLWLPARPWQAMREGAPWRP